MKEITSFKSENFVNLSAARRGVLKSSVRKSRRKMFRRLNYRLKSWSEVILHLGVIIAIAILVSAAPSQSARLGSVDTELTGGGGSLDSLSSAAVAARVALAASLLEAASAANQRIA